MIKDIFFVGKMFVLTVVVVLLMQIQIAGRTVDDSFHQWIKHSIVIDYIEEAVEGGRLIFHTVYQKADSAIHSLMAKTIQKHEKKKSRELNFSLKRHTEKDLDEEENLPQAKVPTSKIY